MLGPREMAEIEFRGSRFLGFQEHRFSTIPLPACHNYDSVESRDPVAECCRRSGFPARRLPRFIVYMGESAPAPLKALSHFPIPPPALRMRPESNPNRLRSYSI